MKKFTFLLSCFLLIGMVTANAQTRKASGTVISGDDNEPVVGASVIVKGTALGSATNEDGRFEIANVPANATTLVISYLGYETQEVPIGANVHVVLNVSTTSLEEVVVTALGISREKKSLGYAAQEISSTQITQGAQNNLANSLSGKIAGIQVTQAGGQIGASQNIVIRGFSSFGSNAPLIVVDGVPVTNDNPTGATRDLGSGINDINTNDVESISVLKGGSAALYGMRAGNGVILITTKSGKKSKSGVQVNYTGDFTVDQVYGIPKLQNKYGQGYGGSEYDYKLALEDGYEGSYSDYAQEYGYYYVDGSNGVNDGDDESWGPRLDIGLMIPQFNSPVVNGVYQPTPWVSHPDNISSFFQTGITQNHTMSVLSASEHSSTRASLGYRGQTGTTPNTNLNRYSASVNNAYELNKHISFEIDLNYVHSHSDNLPGTGYSTTNPLQSMLQWFGRQVDMKSLKENYEQLDEQGNYTHYNWIGPFHANPYWVQYHNTSAYKRDRVFGKSSLWYKPTEYLKFEARVGLDRISSRQKSVIEWDTDSPDGYFRDWQRGQSELNIDLIGYFNKSFGDLNTNAILGANYRDNNTFLNGIGGDQLTIPALYTITNVKGNPVASTDNSWRRSNSIYANLSLGWKSMLYLDLSARNDWDSTIDDDFFYPSASLSWIPTATFSALTDLSWLSYLKLRGGWAKIGSATDPYRNGSYYSAESTGMKGVGLFRMPTTYPPIGLRPEMIKTWEIGLEANFLNNRIRFDGAYYFKNTTDQIMTVNVSRATGYGSMLLNAGEIENKGVELTLAGDVIYNPQGFGWTTTFNWAKDRSKIIDLYTDPVTGQSLAAYTLGSNWNATTLAIPGKTWGTIRGYGFVYDDNGAIKVRNGLPLRQAAQDIGDVTPDWIGGWNNEFSYKDFRFGFLLDFRKGGDFHSVTQMFGTYTGIYDFTAAGTIRENGMVLGKDFYTDKTFVNEDGSPNTTVVNPADFFTYFYSITEMSVIDGSFLKLREAHLTYNFPKKILGKYFSNASVSLVGNNLALLWTHKSNLIGIDPESVTGSGNGSVGIESNVYPHSRSMGLKLNVTF
ncbi:MAG: SusC/RagA family TonB-linked outer membrane protein [Tannerella sp.]|jgi:TonB-linked SusC/RagA family outer membrane protein|nr:SusC/RagA family TonB-linked outer membrane protein [Tannerella sp.]